MIFAEPEAVYQERRRQELKHQVQPQSTLPDRGWNHYLIGYVHAQKGVPISYRKLVNVMVESFRTKDRAVRRVVTRDVIESVKLLIRSGRFRRHKRKMIIIVAEPSPMAFLPD